MKYFLAGMLLILSSWGFSQEKQLWKSQHANNPDSLRHRHLIDSLQKKLPGKNDEEKFEILYSLCREFITINQDSSFKHITDAQAIAMILSDSLRIVRACNAKGLIYKNKGELTLAIDLFSSALKISRRNNFNTQVKFLLNNLALAETQIANYYLALQYHLESLKVRLKEADAMDIAVVMNNIGVLYEELNDYDNALHYYQECLETKLKNKINRDLVTSIANVGGVLNKLSKYELAEDRIKEAFALCDTINCNPTELTIINRVYGENLFYRNRFSEAEVYFMKALNLLNLHMNKVHNSENALNLALTLFYVGSVEHKLERDIEAQKYLSQSIQLARKSGFQKILLDNYFLLSKIHYSKNNYEEAYSYLNRYDQLKSEILSSEVLNKIAFLQNEHEERKNIAMIKSQMTEMNLQRKLNFAMGGIALLTLCLTLVLFRINRQKQKINSLLSARVNERTIDLEQSRDDLVHAHNELAIVLSRVSAELTASHATLKGLTNVASNDMTPELVFYFRQAESTAERLINYVRQYVKK